MTEIKPQSSVKAYCQNCAKGFLSVNSDGAKKHLKFYPSHLILGSE